jgi:hypothetical protein
MPPKKRKAARRARTSKSSVSTMPKLKRQTTKNTRAIAQLRRNTMPIRRFYDTDSGTISSETHVDLLTQPSNWAECFQSHEVPGTDLPRQYNLTNIRFKWACQCESDASGNQWLQMFLVSLKPKVAAKVIERTTRLSNMENNVDYIKTSAGSTGAALQGDCLFMLNPAYYTIHYNSGVRRIGQTTMGGTTGNVTNIRDSTTRGTANVKFKKVFKNDEYSEEGFKAIDSAHLEPRNHLYLVMLSNAQETSEIFLTYNCLYTGRCAAPQ